MLAPVRAVCDGVAGSVQVFLTAMVMPAAARGTSDFELFFRRCLLKIFGAPLGFALVSVKKPPGNKKKGKAIRS